MSTLSTKPSLQKTVDDIQESVNSLKALFNDTGEPINDDNTVVQRLCVKIEFLLQHGLVEHSSFLSGKKNYWNFFLEGLASVKGVSDGLKFVKSLGELKTNVGRGRAFIRFCLMYQRLADCLQLCVSNVKLLNQWYRSSSVWQDSNLSSYLISILYDLNTITFDLGAKGYDLDNGWPSFARHGSGSAGTQKWDIISQSSSMLSLNQSFVAESPRMSSSYLHEVEESVGEDLLSQHLEQAEKSRKDEQEQYQSVIDELTNQLESKSQKIAVITETSRQERETAQRAIDTLNADASALQEKLSSLTKQAEDKDLEFSSAVKDFDEKNSEKSMEVKALEFSVKSLKSRELEQASVIQDLERKAKDLEERNTSLLTKFQGIAENKCDQATAHLDSIQKIEKLLQRISLLESEQRVKTSELEAKNQRCVELERSEQLLNQSLIDCENRLTISASSLKEPDIAAEKTCQQLEADLQTRIIEKQVLQQQYSELEQTHDNLLQECESLKQSQESMKAKMLTTLNMCDKRSEALKESMGSAENLAHNLHEEMEVLHSQLIKETRLSEERQALLDDTTVKLQSEQNLSSSLSLQLAELKSNYKEMFSNLESLQCEQNDNKNIIQQMTEDKMKRDEDLKLVSDTLDSALESLAKLENEKVNLHDKLQSVETARNELVNVQVEEGKTHSKAVHGLNHKLSMEPSAKQNILTEVATLKQQQCDLETKQKSITEHECDLLMQVASLNNSVKKLEELLTESQNVADNVNKTNATLQKTKEKIEERNEKLSAELAKTNEQLNEKTLQLQSNQKTLEILKKETKEFQDKMLTALTTVSSLQSQLKKVNAELEEQKLTNSHLQGKLQRQESAIMMTETEIKEKLEQVCTEKDEFANQLKVSGSEKQKLCKVLEDTISERDRLQARLENMETEKDVLETAQVAVREEIESLRESLTSLKQQELEKTKELNEVQRKLEATRLEWNSQQGVMEQQMKALRFQLSSQQMEGDIAMQGYKEQQAEVYRMGQTMTAQERVMVAIEMQLESLQDEKTLENDLHAQQIQEFASLLDEKESELVLLTDEVETLKEISERASAVEKTLTENIVHLKLESTEKLAANENELHQMREDNMMLRKRLVRLIKDKDSLWKKTDELVFQNRAKADVKWIESSSVLNCMGCRTQFSLMLRKHHCRLCGRVFCWQCANNWIDTVSSSKKSRACNQCYIEHNQQPAESVNSVSLVDESEKLDNDDSLPAHINTRQWRTNGDDHSLISPSSDACSPNQQIPSSGGTSCTSASNQLEDDEVRETISPLQSPVQYSDNHLDEFEEITDEEIARSLGESAKLSISNHNRDSSFTACPWDIIIPANNLDENVTEVTIAAGKSYIVCVEVTQKETSISWDFSTTPKSILFSVSYQSSPGSESEDLIPSCKCNSHRHAITGEMIAHNQGLYVFTFDNTFSMYLAKTLLYKIFTGQRMKSDT